MILMGCIILLVYHILVLGSKLSKLLYIVVPTKCFFESGPPGHTSVYDK